MNSSAPNTTRIAQLNDRFRSCFGIGGHVIVTDGIRALPESEQSAIREKVETFNEFTEDNDPYREHDFGRFEHDGHTILWKIDYYDATLTWGSEDPSDPRLTMRVLTIMLGSEY